MKKVAEAVDVRVGHAVVRDHVCVSAGITGVVRAGAIHRVEKGRAVIHRFHFLGIARQRNGNAFFHQSESCAPFRGRDQIQRAELVVCSPAAPVGHFAHQSLEILF